MGIKYKVVAGEKYTDRDGQDKTRWTTLGKVIQSQKGFSVKFDMIPVGWDGWAYLFEPEDKKDQDATKTESKPAKQAAIDPSDDIPF